MNTRRSFIKKASGTVLVFGIGSASLSQAWIIQVSNASGCFKTPGTNPCVAGGTPPAHLSGTPAWKCQGTCSGVQTDISCKTENGGTWPSPAAANGHYNCNL